MHFCSVAASIPAILHRKSLAVSVTSIAFQDANSCILNSFNLFLFSIDIVHYITSPQLRATVNDEKLVVLLLSSLSWI